MYPEYLENWSYILNKTLIDSKSKNYMHSLNIMQQKCNKTKRNQGKEKPKYFKLYLKCFFLTNFGVVNGIFKNAIRRNLER